ncbi:MAG: DUF1573 domain-containing protein [candidate division Zixibacteria bacterium]|nr:DUF1573 domain-containing protein [candidate division Zixibacteria bacterium]
MVIPPGSGASIDLITNSADCIHANNKRAFFDCNDPADPRHEVRVILHVDSLNNTLLKYSPIVADFGEVSSGEKAELKLTLTNDDSTASEVVIVSPSLPKYVKETVIAKPKLAPGESTTITMSLHPAIPRGEFLSSLTLEAKDKPNSRISISVKGKVGNVK